MIGAIKDVVSVCVRKINADDRCEMSRPFSLGAVGVAGCGNDMGSLEPGVVSPLFMRQNKLGQTPAAKTAVQDLVAALDRFLHTGADKMCLGKAASVNYPEASYLGVRGKLVDDVGDGSAVTIGIVA